MFVIIAHRTGRVHGWISLIRLARNLGQVGAFCSEREKERDHSFCRTAAEVAYRNGTNGTTGTLPKNLSSVRRTITKELAMLHCLQLITPTGVCYCD